METTVSEPLETKVVAPKLLLYSEGKTTLRQIHSYANEAVAALMEEAAKAGLEAAGALEFIYFGATADEEKEFTLQLALPVNEEKEVGEGFQFRKTAPFTCVSYVYKGDVSEIGCAYESLYGQIAAKQLQPTNEIREVYRQWEHLTSSNNLTEIQIGIN